MGMPLTRDLTLGPGSTFPSTLGNTLQDCIIGAKYGPIDLPISASAFVVDTGAPTRSQNIWTFQTSAGNTIIADLRLPVGTKIKWRAGSVTMIDQALAAPLCRPNSDPIGSQVQRNFPV